MEKLSTRHYLSKKESKEVLKELNRLFACEINERAPVERAHAPSYQLLFIEGEPLAIRCEDQYFLTLKGLLRYKPKRKWAMVDKGAIKFVSKGADVMAPGIVNADEQIIEQELVWICDEEHFAPLAIGKALMDGKEMVKAKKGKAIRSIFHVGDKLWRMQG
jgi:PUA domain protein